MSCRHRRHPTRFHSIIKHSAHDLTIYPVCIFGDCIKLVPIYEYAILHESAEHW